MTWCGDLVSETLVLAEPFWPGPKHGPIVLSLVCTSSCPMDRYSASISSIPILVLVLVCMWGCTHVCARMHMCSPVILMVYSSFLLQVVLQMKWFFLETKQNKQKKPLNLRIQRIFVFPVMLARPSTSTSVVGLLTGQADSGLEFFLLIAFYKPQYYQTHGQSSIPKCVLRSV